MTSRVQLIGSVATSGSVGLAVSTGSLAGIAVSILLPAMWARQKSARSCFLCAFSYYLAALWSLPVVARNFFGPSAGFIDSLILWLTASVLLTLPVRFAWSGIARSALWRVPIALLASIVPPLGLIGWASPTVAAGLLFPATGYVGFALAILMPGCLAVYPKQAAGCVAVLTFVCNLIHPNFRETPPDWQGINTNYGGVANEQANPQREYQISADIQARALASTARVIVFPESVLPRWTPASDLFWADTTTALKNAGKVVVIGAIKPSGARHSDYDFAPSLEALYKEAGVHQNFRGAFGQRAPVTYTNGVVVRGASSSELTQRIPVPIGMWHPFSSTGAPIRLSGPAVIRIADQTAGVVICYEQLIPWPTLTALLERPTIIIATANYFWVTGTTIPQVQRNSIRAWARLFHVPVVFASNT